MRPAEGEVLEQKVYDRMTGLEVMLGHISGELPVPPIGALVGFRPVSAAEGEVTFVCPASEWLCSPLAKVEGGVIALIAETPLVCSIQTLLPAGTSYAPLDLKVNFLRPVAPDGAELVATGRVIHSGRTICIATSEVVDAEGRKVAIAAGSALVLPGRPWRREPPPAPAQPPEE
jgi:uncharacterized protein (TIGR00369 family)